MTTFMNVLTGVISLLACYFPAVAGARGRSSRRSWIVGIFVGLFVAGASMMIGHHLVWTFDPVLLSQSESGSFVRQMTANLLAMIVRISISFCFGSFLATLLYRKHQAESGNLLGLESEINKRQL
jgi:hypothetical protein